MKVLSIVLFAQIICLSSLFAQGPDRGKEKGDRLEKMKSELNLSDEQAKEIEVLFTEREKEKTEKREAIKEILTEEQFEKFSEMKKGAHRRAHGKHHHKGRKDKELPNEEQKAFLQSLRLELDEYISQTDKLAIQELREQSIALKEEAKEAKIAKEKDIEKEDREGFWKDWMEKREAIFVEASKIAENYQTEIDRLLEENKSELDSFRPKDRKEHHDGHKHGHKKKDHKQARFLLMAPGDMQERKSENILPKRGFDIYPNPSNQVSQVSYELDNKSVVKVELIDESGRLVDLLLEQEKEKGSHTFEMDTSKYSAGIYYISLSVGDKQRSEKLIIQN